jgi:hypothetical protein
MLFLKLKAQGPEAQDKEVTGSYLQQYYFLGKYNLNNIGEPECLNSTRAQREIWMAEILHTDVTESFPKLHKSLSQNSAVLRIYKCRSGVSGDDYRYSKKTT